jgi:hypothetical protein
MAAENKDGGIYTALPDNMAVDYRGNRHTIADSNHTIADKTPGIL